MKVKSLLIILLLSTTSIFSMAGNITGKLVFEKKPPFAGALYIKEGGSPVTSAMLDQANKNFDKKIFVVSKGVDFQIRNSDTFQHNIFVDDKDTGVRFDVGLMEPDTVVNKQVDWASNTMTRIGCKIHPKMRSYVLNIPTNVYQLLEFNKKIKEYDINLADVPDSTSNFVLHLTKYDVLEFSLSAGESKTIDVTRKDKKRATLTVSR